MRRSKRINEHRSKLRDTPGKLFENFKPHSIPMTLYQTYKTRKNIPLLCFPYLTRMEYHFYDDDDCLAYMKTKPRYLNAYINLKDNAHKADLWRYLILYEYGGVYLDIKCQPKKDLQFIFDFGSREKYTWYTCRSGLEDFSIHNGIIATPPKNPVLLKCADLICKYANSRELELSYELFCKQMFRVISNEHSFITTNILENRDSKCILLSEQIGDNMEDCECSGFSHLDRYDLCCNAYLDGECVFKVRDENFPWS